MNIHFTQSPGCINAAAALDTEQPADFDELFISIDLEQNAVAQTNLYADQCIQPETDASPHARIHAWKLVAVSGMEKFVGLFFFSLVLFANLNLKCTSQQTLY